METLSWVMYDSPGKLMSGSTKVPANGEAKKESASFNLGSYAGLLDSTMGSTAAFFLMDGLEVNRATVRPESHQY